MSRRATRSRAAGGRDNRFRIIGGRHRGRRLTFPDVADLRPSPDRVRETLFNWLGAQLPGSRCLDLFAGSGALGLEALSRGAGHVCFVDRSAAATHAIGEHLAALGLFASARVETLPAEAALGLVAGQPYDIVFLDPPFRDNDWQRLCTLLAGCDAVKPGSLVYLEYPADTDPRLPANWPVVRQSRAGRVGFALARVGAAGDWPLAGEQR
jgi:16S rRNA (guanine966-N2)-methyltransferase